MVNTRINHKKHLCPDCWDDVTTGLFERLATDWQPELEKDQRDRVKLFAMLTGTEYETVRDSDGKLAKVIYDCTEFVYKTSPRNVLTQTLKLGNKVVVIPHGVGELTAGQNIQVRQHVNRVGIDEACISYTIAAYIQPLYDAKVIDGLPIKADFNHDRAIEIAKLIDKLPITQTYGIGSFFLTELGVFGTSYLKSLKRKLVQIARSVISLLNWRKPILLTVYSSSQS